jgi:DNA repair protein RadA/Sms
VEVPDPNQIFLSESGKHNGTSIGCVIEGSRSFIVEVQLWLLIQTMGHHKE